MSYCDHLSRALQTAGRFCFINHLASIKICAHVTASCHNSATPPAVQTSETLPDQILPAGPDGLVRPSYFLSATEPSHGRTSQARRSELSLRLICPASRHDRIESRFYCDRLLLPALFLVQYSNICLRRVRSNLQSSLSQASRCQNVHGNCRSGMTMAA